MCRRKWLGAAVSIQPVHTHMYPYESSSLGIGVHKMTCTHVPNSIPRTKCILVPCENSEFVVDPFVNDIVIVSSVMCLLHMALQLEIFISFDFVKRFFCGWHIVLLFESFWPAHVCFLSTYNVFVE